MSDDSPPPLRILQVMAGSPHGGAEAFFVDLCCALSEAGAVIEVVTRPHDARVSRLEQAGLRVHRLPFGRRLDVYTPWALGRIIRAFAPDTVQTWMARASALVPSPRQKPYQIVARLGGYYNLKYFRKADYLVANTPGIRDYLLTAGIAPDRAVQINNFAPHEGVTVPIVRQELGTPEDATLLLGLGRLHHDKAFDTLIKVVGRLPDRFHLWIAGEGPDRRQLTDLIAQQGLEARVKLLGWRDDRAALLQACDICTFTSRDEPFGNVFVQAWAQKTPVVVSDADGPRHFVRDGEDGLVTRIDDQDSIIKAVMALEGDSALRTHLVEKGWARYQDEFTTEKIVQSWLDFYGAIRRK